MVTFKETTPPVERNFVLELSQVEAQAIKDILGHFNSAGSGPKGVTHGIYQAIDEVIKTRRYQVSGIQGKHISTLQLDNFDDAF